MHDANRSPRPPAPISAAPALPRAAGLLPLALSSAAGLVALGLLLATAAAPVRADQYSGPPTPCDKELSVADAAGILVGKAAITHYSMGALTPGAGCELGVSSGGAAFAMIDFSVQNSGVQFFQNIIQFAPVRTPIGGVGDEAYDFGATASNIPNATQTDIYARKGDATCIVELHRTTGATGDALVVPQTGAGIATKLAALCQKVFTARAGK